MITIGRCRKKFRDILYGMQKKFMRRITYPFVSIMYHTNSFFAEIDRDKSINILHERNETE